MFQLDEELLALAARLNAAGVEYAVCGGLAVGLHGHPRATKDIDLVVTATSIFAAKREAKACGFDIESGTLTFQDGEVHVTRLVKTAPGERDVLMLDLLTFREDIAAALEFQDVLFRDVRITALTKDSLIRLKRDAGRPQDLADIERLTSHEEGT